MNEPLGRNGAMKKLLETPQEGIDCRTDWERTRDDFILIAFCIATVLWLAHCITEWSFPW